MKFQLITTAAALLVASVAALPTPRPDNHGLLTDTDDVVDDGTIEFVEARGLKDDDEVNDAIVARSTEDAEVSEAIDFIEVRSTENADVEESIEFVATEDADGLEARDVDDEVTEDIEILQARDVEDDEVSESIEVLDARSAADHEEEVGEGNEPWIEARDVDDEASEEEVGEGNEPWLEARDVEDEASEEEVGEGNEPWLEARDVEDEASEEVGEGNEPWIEARDVEDDVTESIEEVGAAEVEARDVEDDVTESIEEVGAAEVEARDVEDDVTESIEEVGSSEVEARETETETEAAIEARSVRITEAAANFNFTADFDSALDRLLAAIDDIPDEILEQGDDALHKWLVKHGYREGNEKLKRDDDTDVFALLTRGELAARASIWNIAKCVASIVQLLATTAVPAAKLLRIKKYIKALGGTKDAVKLLLGATTKAEKLKVGGEVLVALAAELLGISTVKNNCF